MLALSRDSRGERLSGLVRSVWRRPATPTDLAAVTSFGAITAARLFPGLDDALRTDP